MCDVAVPDDCAGALDVGGRLACADKLAASEVEGALLSGAGAARVEGSESAGLSRPGCERWDCAEERAPPVDDKRAASC